MDTAAKYKSLMPQLSVGRRINQSKVLNLRESLRFDSDEDVVVYEDDQNECRRAFDPPASQHLSQQQLPPASQRDRVYKSNSSDFSFGFTQESRVPMTTPHSPKNVQHHDTCVHEILLSLNNINEPVDVVNQQESFTSQYDFSKATMTPHDHIETIQICNNKNTLDSYHTPSLCPQKDTPHSHFKKRVTRKRVDEIENRIDFLKREMKHKAWRARQSVTEEINSLMREKRQIEYDDDDDVVESDLC